jgi:hypothetical protein
MRKIFYGLLLFLCAPAQAAQHASFNIVLQIEGLPNPPPKVDYLEIDGFDSSKELVTQIKANGTKAICYISVGTAEDFRPDFAELKKIPNTVGKAYPNFAGDYFINTNHWRDFFPVMEKRIMMCKDKGFDYVDFDVIDSYAVDPKESGFDLTEETQIAYIMALTDAAHAAGLKTVQKNTTELAVKLEPHFDALLLEQCMEYDFCDEAAPYVRAEKPVFNIEYPDSTKEDIYAQAVICRKSEQAGIRTIFSNLALDRLAFQTCP